MNILIRSGKQEGDDKLDEWKNNLVVFIERKVGFHQALTFANEFEAKGLLCRIVYDQGKQYYQFIYKGV